MLDIRRHRYIHARHIQFCFLQENSHMTTPTPLPVHSEKPRASLWNKTGTRPSLNCSIFEPLRRCISEDTRLRHNLNLRHSNVDVDNLNISTYLRTYTYTDISVIGQYLQIVSASCHIGRAPFQMHSQGSRQASSTWTYRNVMCM